jgi:hypothetical protein
VSEGARRIIDLAVEALREQCLYGGYCPAVVRLEDPALNWDCLREAVIRLAQKWEVEVRGGPSGKSSEPFVLVVKFKGATGMPGLPPLANW